MTLHESIMTEIDRGQPLQANAALRAMQKQQHEELLRLVATRQRMIAYVEAKEGNGFTAAEKVVDGKA